MDCYEAAVRVAPASTYLAVRRVALRLVIAWTRQQVQDIHPAQYRPNQIATLYTAHVFETLLVCVVYTIVVVVPGRTMTGVREAKGCHTTHIHTSTHRVRPPHILRPTHP